MLSRSAIAVMAQSTKSSLLSAYCSMMSVARAKSSVVGKTSSSSPATADLITRIKCGRPISRMIMYASSVKMTEGSNGRSSFSNTSEQASWARSAAETTANRKPVSMSAAKLIQPFLHDLILAAKSLQPLQRHWDYATFQSQQKKNGKIHWAVVQMPARAWDGSGHRHFELQAQIRGHVANNLAVSIRHHLLF